MSLRVAARRRSSPLVDIVASAWEPDWTTELLHLLRVLTLLVDLEPQQAELLAHVTEGPLVTVEDLTDAGVLPVPQTARTTRDRPR